MNQFQNVNFKIKNTVFQGTLNLESYPNEITLCFKSKNLYNNDCIHPLIMKRQCMDKYKYKNIEFICIQINRFFTSCKIEFVLLNKENFKRRNFYMSKIIDKMSIMGKNIESKRVRF